MGGGINATGFVSAMTVHDGKLIAGGYFSRAGGTPVNNIAQWDGETWQPLGEGIGHGEDGTQILSLLEYQGDLIAATYDFDHAIMQWNGENWDPLENGIASYSEIYTLSVYQGNLVAGGMIYADDDPYSNYVVSWNGERWEVLPGKFDWYVYALAAYDDELFASSNALVKWNGDSWGPVGLGFSYYISCLTIFDKGVIAAGPFRNAGGLRANGIARWNGISWERLGEGLLACWGWTTRDGCSSTWVNALGVHDGRLFVGGSFKMRGEDETTIVAQWDGATWQSLCRGPLGDYPGVLAIASFDGRLIAGGKINLAGGVVVNNIAAWDGSTWQSLDGGMNGIVRDLVVYEGKLIAAGDFTVAGGVSVNRIAKWDGAMWEPFGNESNGLISRIEVFGGKVVAIRQIETAPGIQEYHVAESDGGNWRRLGDAMNGPISILAVVGDKLMAGGNFTRVGDTNVNYVAQWDGKEWSSPFKNLNVYPRDLAFFNGDVIVAGNFAVVGEGTRYFARWGPACSPGDMNCDGVVDKFDLQPFVNALLDPDADTDCTRYLANVSGDVEADGASKVDGADVAPFIEKIMKSE